jgi:hypothetical protein
MHVLMLVSTHLAAETNLSVSFGIAEQGDDYGSDVASKAIDGDLNTINHTQCNDTDNWWQVALPNPSQVSRIVVTGRSSWTSRINGAEVFITDEAYAGTLDVADKVFTLAGTGNAQEITLATPQSAAYVIIKAANGNCLHMREVDVYGEAPSEPAIKPHSEIYLIPHTTTVGSVLTQLEAIDWQDDPLTYNILGNVPFSIDAEGLITVSSILQAGGQYVFDVVVSDGISDVQTTLTVNVTSETAVEDAISTGSVTHVTAEELLDETLSTINANQSLLDEALVKLFNLNTDGSAKVDGSSLTSIDWNPTHDASTLIPTYGLNRAILHTNDVTDISKTIHEKTLGVVGETLGGNTARYMVLGSNPMRNHYRSASAVNEQMHQLLENSLAWLTERDDLKTTPFNVVISHLSQSYYFPDEVAVRNWLDEHYPSHVNYNNENTCDDTALASCLSNPTDLLIVSQVLNGDSDANSIAATVEQAMQQGIPVLYLHHDGGFTDLGRSLFPLFHVSYEWDNYWKKLQLTDYDPRDYQHQMPANIQSIKTMLEHFKHNDYNFDWTACSGENCSAVTGLDTEFLQGAEAVRSLFRALDENKINVFAHTQYRFEKLLALLGDKYRQAVQFPMDKESTDDNTFLKAYFTDHAVYNYRPINPVQTDMGNFSRSDFSHVTSTNKTVNLNSKVNFRSAGVYALPGQTVRVTRTDNSEVTTKIYVNSLRSGSTHQWANNGYVRPKYLQSVHFPIASGETIAFTSPYGGPIQIEFDSNDLPVTFQFENIGEHPYWASSADDVSFTQKLADGHYDWAELVTPGFQVHSQLEKMRSSMNNWGSAQALADNTMQYTHNYPHVLAGFQGPGIDAVPELHDFANTNGWTIDVLDKVKHMNADQATCGYGCSGNPYDAYWSFSPTEHGDIHELGHGLQGGMRFIGWENHSMTNHYSYYTKSKYHEETGEDPNCQSLPFREQFAVLQASINQTDPAAYMQAQWWDSAGWSQQASMLIQTMMSAEVHGALDNGWHLRALLHILEREFNRAKKDEVTWLQKRDAIGFSTYSLAEAQAIDNNDWLLIAISFSTRMDHRDYINMWGLPFSTKADAQVASFGYPIVPRRYYISPAKGYCEDDDNGPYLKKASLPVDGQQTWPEETDTDGDTIWDAVDNCPDDANPEQQDLDQNGIGDVCETVTPLHESIVSAAAEHNIIRQALNNQSTLDDLGFWLDQSYDFSLEPKPVPALPDMVDDVDVQTAAAEHAEMCLWAHIPGDYGQNLFAGTSDIWTIKHAVNSWADEAQHYDFATDGCAEGEQCKHYTQMVWENSTKVGCAVHTCDRIVDINDNPIFGGVPSTMIVCHYDSPGNYVGQKPYRTGEDLSDDSDSSGTSTSVKLQLKAMLQGAYQYADGLMHDDIRTSGLLPSSQPYSNLNYSVNDVQLDSSLLDITGENAVVDWMLVELRDDQDPTQILTSKATLIQRDGDFIDPITGSNTLAFPTIQAGNYHVAIRHLNHLGVMTETPITLSSDVTLIDFSSPATQVWGEHARLVSDSVHLLWAGDTNHDGKVIAMGEMNDTNSIFGPVILAGENTDRNRNYVLNEYSLADVNRDAKVIAAGNGNDENMIRANVLLHPGNELRNGNYVILGQLP